MYIHPVRSMLYPHEQLPAYTPRVDPDTASILSSAPSYTSQAPSYHSRAPSYHTFDERSINGDFDFEADVPSSNEVDVDEANSRPATSAVHNAPETPRLPSPQYAPGFESRALRHGNPSELQLRALYNLSSWVPVNAGLQSRAYENVARRRAQQARAEAVLLRSLTGGTQSLTDVSRTGNLARPRPFANPVAATVASNPATPEASRSPLGSSLYGLVNSSTASVAATLREEPVNRVATPQVAPLIETTPAPETEETPLSPHEDPYLVGEEAAARARSQRLYITTQTQENQLHGLLAPSVGLEPPALGISRPTTPFRGGEPTPAASRSTPSNIQNEADRGPSPSPSRPPYTSLVEQGLQARAQRSRSSSSPNPPTVMNTSRANTTRPASPNSAAPPASNASTTPSTRSSRSTRSATVSGSTAMPAQAPVQASSPPAASTATSTAAATPAPPSTASAPSPPPSLSSASTPSSSSSALSPPTPTIRFSASVSNLLPMTPESEEEHQPTRTRGRRRRAQPTRPSSPILEDTPSSSEDDLPPLTNSITAPQPPIRRNDGMNPSGRISPTQEALLIAQESKSWDFMMSQMADWEERQQSWKKFRDGIERKFYSGRRMGLGLHGIIGWSPFHGHSKSSREERKEEKKLRGRKRAVSSSAAQGGRGWRRRVAGLAV